MYEGTKSEVIEFKASKCSFKTLSSQESEIDASHHEDKHSLRITYYFL